MPSNSQDSRDITPGDPTRHALQYPLSRHTPDRRNTLMGCCRCNLTHPWIVLHELHHQVLVEFTSSSRLDAASAHEYASPARVWSFRKALLEVLRNLLKSQDTRQENR